MKNLKLSLELSSELQLQSERETLLLSAFDVEQNRVFFASSANAIYTVHLPSSHLERGLMGKTVLPSQGESIALEHGDRITALDYQMEKEALIIGTSNGYLVLYLVDCNTIEVVGNVEGGVTCVASSPDGALLTVTSGLGQLLVMTHDWEILYETTLDPQLVDEMHCQNSLVDKVDGSYSYEARGCISWRGDGKYFATLNGLQNSSSLRKLMIWERDSGTLHATTDLKAFMGSSLDWMPSGAKVACAYDRKAENKCPSIVFFEKNGLERSSFSINEHPETQVKTLKWNCISDLLAASITCGEYDAIKIWSFSNNHWYLKQEMRYLKKDGVKFAWNPTRPLHLISWTQCGKITTYTFVWMTAVTESSVALVVDNSSVLFSPFVLSLRPPPMSLFNLRFPSAIRDISFYAKNSENHLAVLLSDGHLCVVDLSSIDMWEQFEDQTLTIETSLSDLSPSPFWHLTWLDSHIILGVSHCKYREYDNRPGASFGENGFSHEDSMMSSDGYYLQEIEFVTSENCERSVTSDWRVKKSKKFSIEGPIISVVQNPAKTCSAFLQLDGGSIFEYSSTLSTKASSREHHLCKLDSDNVLPSSCPWMKAVLVSDNGIMKPLIFGLNDSGRLHVGRRILCNNCSSFSFYSDSEGLRQKVTTHLILTTKQDLLFIFSMDEILHGSPEIQIENCNRGNIQRRKEENKDFIPIWERGAKLVGVIPGDEAAVILQANRGNLECIYPRKLVLVAIANTLVQRRFRDAMIMVRRHRLDFNVIVDYCGWQTFIKSAGEFVSQVSNLGHITDFVCAIKNENVMETLYKAVTSLPCSKITLRLNSVDADDLLENKVSSVLQAVRNALEESVVESPERELCILTTLARSEPPALEQALGRIKMICEMELLGVDDVWRKTCPSAEEAIKHLLWLSDPEAVYEAALGLYDLNLSAIVALNSQKDPKEFLPFLQSLEQLPPVVMRYKIDLRLHKNESALRHIASAGEDYYEDGMRLLQSNPELFPLGLQLFSDPTKRNHVLEAWGDHLHGEKCFERAATAYICCSSFQKALKAYRACGDWKGVLTVAGHIRLGKVEVFQLANELCEELQALGKPAEAAKLALEYCRDVSSCVGYFIAAREWEEAVRIGYLHERDDLVSEVTIAAIDCANTLVSEYNEGSEKVGKYLARYVAVRQRRLLLAAKLQMEERPGNELEEDNVSEASSTFSGMSAYTASTMKGSRVSISPSTVSKGREMRRQRNRGKIRAGSPGEEKALIEHLKGMALTSTAQDELKSLVLALAMLGKVETARQVQRAADNFDLYQQAAVKLCEDTNSSEIIDEDAHTLEHYVNKIKGTTSFLSSVLVV
uniref:Elongator complex protein 1 n=1 Tax=Anthurium amnicola TaxID=1678845 RepID=A0A1D1YPX5_9ARAE